MQNRSAPAQQKDRGELKIGWKRIDTQWKQMVRIQTRVSFRIVQERAKTVQRFMTEAQTILLNGCDMSAPLAMFLTMRCWFRASAAARTMVKCVSKVERRVQRAVALPVMSLSGQPSHQGFSQDSGVRSMIDGPAIGSFGGD